MMQKSVRIVMFIVLVSGLVIQSMDFREAGQAAAQAQLSTNQQFIEMMARINTSLEANGAEYRVDQVEYLTAAESGEIGQTVFFSNRGNKQLGAHFVPGDPRRGGRSNITYIVDQAEGAIDRLSVAQTTAAIDRAMGTWDEVKCSKIPITKVPDIAGLDIGVVEFLLGQVGGPFFLADITHAGWLPANILPNGVIAATFTFIFNDPVTLQPSDIDSNGKADVAFREILYNDFHTWGINANIDVETVALHESGHGLSQDHFGKAFITGSNVKIHFAPRAVMNAAYSGVQQEINGTDNGGHCSIWGKWPNN
ncbi:MAG: hypothetical protein L0220_32290 [Acidobacteria bacterium]|nr:hypothetical protein [Acidobacteriota bacterium]